MAASGGIAVPQVGNGQILIKVAAAGVNRPDVLQRKGLYPAPKGHSEILGLEVAGQVAAAGAGVTKFKTGDAVMALVNGGGCAEYCLAVPVDGVSPTTHVLGVAAVRSAPAGAPSYVDHLQSICLRGVVSGDPVITQMIDSTHDEGMFAFQF